MVDRSRIRPLLHCEADEVGSFADIQLEDVTDVVWLVMLGL